MSKKAKELLKNPWVIGVGTIIIAQIIFWIFNLNLIKGIIIFLIHLTELIYKLLASSIVLPAWAFILCILAIPIIVILISVLTPKKKEPDPFPYDYRKDQFDGIVWRWTYHPNKYTKRIDIENLVPFCPKCDCQLGIYGGGYLSCPNCGFEEHNYGKSESDLKMLIYHQIRQRYSLDK